jgi:hypothetical protein
MDEQLSDEELVTSCLEEDSSIIERTRNVYAGCM